MAPWNNQAPQQRKPMVLTGGGAMGVRQPPPKMGPQASAGKNNASSGNQSTKSVPYKVTSQNSADDVGIQTLLGDYTEKGDNHGRKYYQKTQRIPGHENINVFLYYWDKRDGDEFSGWWFGDQVGGSQVWARVPSHAQTPPRVGWRIPWDAPTAKTGQLLVDAQRQPVSGAATTTNSTTGSTNVSGTVKRATERLAAVEKTATAAISVSKTLLAENTGSEEDLKTAQESLTKQLAALNEAQKGLTSDLGEVRKLGQNGAPLLAEISKLSPKLRTLMTTVNSELSKLKAYKPKTEEELQKEADDLAAKEESDLEEHMQMISEAEDIVTLAEESIETALALAEPLEENPPEDQKSDEFKASCEEIEKSATTSQHKLSEARNLISNKMSHIKKYAPEARKKAQSEYTALQGKIGDIQKRINPLRSFRKDFGARIEAKKAASELTEGISSLEVDVERAQMMSEVTGQMTEEEITAVEEAVGPINKSLQKINAAVDQKLKVASQGAQREEFAKLKTKLNESRTVLTNVQSSMKKQRDGIASMQIVEMITEKLDAVETAYEKCSEAEMPFLKGIEVLPGEESTNALRECDAAYSATQNCLQQAVSIIKQKTIESRKFAPELAKTVAEDMKPLEERLQTYKEKLEGFRKETSERKTAAALAEVIEAVDAAEDKVNEVSDLGAIFAQDRIEQATVEELADAVEKIASCDKDVNAALGRARTSIATKQKTVRTPDAGPALAKLSQRISTAQADVSKSKKNVLMVERLIKSKKALSDATSAVAKAEENIEKAEELSNDEEVSDEGIQEMDKALSFALQSMKATQRTVDSHVGTAPSFLKDMFTKIQERCKAGTQQSESIKAKCKDKRERVLTEACLREAEKNVDEIEESLEKMNEVELPFLKGIENLALDEQMSAIEASESAAITVQTCISKTRTYQATKTVELKVFAKEATKAAFEKFSSLTERTNAASQKLSLFKKDTEQRKKNAQMQETVEAVAELEEAVKAAEGATEPLGLAAEAKAKKLLASRMASKKKEEDEDSPAEEEAPEVTDEMANSAVDLVRKAVALLEQCRQSLTTRRMDAKTLPSLNEAIKECQEKISTAQKDLVKPRKLTLEHEEKLQARELVDEATEKVAQAAEAVKKGEEVWAPLLENESEELLVSVNITAIATAITDFVSKKAMSLYSYISEVVGDVGLDKQAFDEYLEELPVKIEHEEVEFLAERRALIFKQMDADEDGKISADDFKKIYKKRYTCVQAVSMTSTYDIAGSTTVGRLEPNDVVVSVSGLRVEEKTGTARVQCHLEDNEQVGWVTVNGNLGKVYLQEEKPVDLLTTKATAQFEESMGTITNVFAWFTKTITELNVKKSGPLLDAKTEILQKRGETNKSKTALEAVRRSVAVARRELANREAKEANAHIERKEQRAATAFVEVASTAVSELEVKCKAVDEAATSFLSLEGEDRTQFATPATVLAKTEELLVPVNEAAAAARTAVKEQVEKLPKELKGSMAGAKRELAKLSSRLEGSARSAKKTVDSVKTASAVIVDARLVEVAAAIRKEVKEKDVSWEDLFAKAAGEGGNWITEEQFTKMVNELEDFSIPEQHLKLLSAKLQSSGTANGIGRREFANLIQQYFKVVKGIAITDEFSISSSKTVRKVDVGEIIELIEGPRKEEKSSLPRIRGRCLVDGTEGWITVQGNQGTPFLEKTGKPFYTVTKSISLEKDFQDSAEVRALKSDEILELIEGPKKVQFAPASRVKVRASSDKSIGWITAKDKTGTELALPDAKLYVCKGTVAMTDNLDLKDCKVVKKLAVGDLFLAIEDVKPEPASKLSRVKGRCLADEKEGWVTLKGNAGTVYAEASAKHYTVVKETMMTKTFKNSGSDQVRMLAVDEALEVIEGPKEEVFPVEVRVKCKAMSDGSVGWLTPDNNKTVCRWSTTYKVLTKTAMHEACEVTEEAVLVRDLAAGEEFEIIEGPMEHGEEAVLRAKGRATKDQAVGWVTLRDSAGKRPMQPKA